MTYHFMHEDRCGCLRQRSAGRGLHVPSVDVFQRRRSRRQGDGRRPSLGPKRSGGKWKKRARSLRQLRMGHRCHAQSFGAHGADIDLGEGAVIDLLVEYLLYGRALIVTDTFSVRKCTLTSVFPYPDHCLIVFHVRRSIIPPLARR